MENRVKLLGYYGGDLTHATSAWTSTSRELTPERLARIPELLKMLAEKGHHTPFEKSTLHFLVTCDTASHIHFLKHRIGVSINAESARYKELKEDKYYVPYDWADTDKQALERHLDRSYELYHNAINTLIMKGFSKKRAKESARFVLPYANQLVLDVTFNFRSFMHFQGLRNKPEAQDEIKRIAQEMLDLVKKTNEFTDSLKAFGYE